MKLKSTLPSYIRRLAPIFLVGLLSASLASAATYTWGGGGADMLWATSGNWAPSGPPSPADSAVFGAAATVADAVTVNNTVGASATIATLSYTNSTSGTWHVTQIPADVTLTVSGNVTIGGGTGTSLTTAAAMTGGGMFRATGSSFNIGNNGASGGATPGTLDLSGLANFVYSASSGTLGLGTLGSRSTGNLTLAAGSNSITAATININGATGTSSTQNFNLGGGTNLINASTFNLGAARATTTFQFSGPTGGLRLRGTGGTDTDRSAILVGNRNTGGTSPLTTTGNVFLNGHPVDLKFSTLTLGVMSRSGTEANFNAVGVFQFDQGTVDATSISMGLCSGNSPTSRATGTLTVGAAGTLTAGSISLANLSSGIAGSGATGTLNISGGTVNCTGDIIKTTITGSTGIVAVTSGTLSVGGSLGNSSNPIDSLNLTSAVLTLRAAASAPATVTTLTTGGSTNLINIGSLPAITAYPVQFQVVKYAGTIGGLGFDNNIGLGTLPSANPAYAGYLSNNTATLTVDLVITNGPAPAQAVTWSGAQNGDWDTSTLNWLAGPAATNYNNAGDFVTFDDSASNAIVNLVSPVLTPGSLTVTNTALAYRFTGSGKLSGGTGLNKQGPGTLVLDNSGVNDFAGSVSLTGTLQVGSGGVSGNLPSAASVTNNGSLVFNRSDNVTLANAISGTGAVVQNGVNTLTVSGANSFAGGLIVSNGALRATSSAAPGKTTVTVYSGGTFVAGATQTNNYILAGGAFGVVSGAMNTVPGELTAAASSTSTLYTADPQNLAATDATEISFTNTWHGSGHVNVLSVTNDTSADAGNGFRLRGTAPSDFSGTLALGNMVKCELQTSVAGPFSPAGTGKLVLTCGSYYGTNNTLAPGVGGYSELNLRNNSPGDTVLGNDLELVGTGLAVLNPLGTAPVGARMTMGSLTLGGGQELALYLASGANPHVLVFPTVTLTGGTTLLSPKSPTFGATTQVGSDLELGNITETAGSGLVMNGLRTLTLAGTSTYSGATIVSNGTLTVSGNLTGSGAVTVQGGTLNGTGAISGPVSIAASGTLAPGTPIGTLIISNSLTLAGTNVMDLSKSGSVLTSDLVTNITTLTCGGTLVLNLAGDQLAAGDSFKLYSFSSAGGAFAAISPATPGTGLLWDTSNLTADGTLRVISEVVVPPQILGITVSGTNVIISGTNATAGGNYYVLSSTNVALPLTNWTSILTQAFNGLSFSFTNAMDPADTQRFYSIQLP